MAFDPTKVKCGPGRLYLGAVGAVEPVNTVVASVFTDVINPAVWFEVGYTDEGHEFTYAPSFDGIPVAEEMLDLRTVQTGLDMTLAFAAAELTSKNIQAALNGGTVVVTGSTGTTLTTFEPPAFGTVTRTAILWEGDEKDERWIYRKCIQTGDVQLSRRKAPAKVTIPMSFKLEVISNAIKPFKSWTAGV